MSFVARAEEPAPRWEVGGFGGYFFGSRIALTPTTETRIEHGPAFGLRGAFALDSRFRFEASISRADVGVATRSLANGSLTAPAQPGHAMTYDLDLLYGFGGPRLKGYLGLGAGAMTLPSYGTRFAANFALGAEVPLDEHFALRLDGRFRWRATDRRIGTIVCEPSLGCNPFPTTLFTSAEATAGVTYRFGAPTPAAPPDDTPRYLGWTAFELAVIDFVPFALNKWVSKYDYAQVTPSTLADNFVTGYTYDRDDFYTNQFDHAFHGNFYYNTGRSNGYTFYESGVVAFVGSWLWECCTEVEPPAINDLLNTTLGGMQVGEIAHRLSRMILDNTLSGSPRLVRELGAMVLNPAGEFSRWVKGEATSDFPNPEDRFPTRFELAVDLGYRHLGNSAAHPDQGLVGVEALYGDPFRGEIARPFDSFAFAIEFASPSEATLSRFEDVGILKGWELTDTSSPARHILGTVMGFSYVRNEVETWGTQSLGLGLLSRYPLGSSLQVETGVTASIFPLAAIKTSEAVDPLSGRNYDYAPGGGVEVAGALRQSGRTIATVSYRVGWATTVDGPSSSNTLQTLRASARYPISRRFGAGASYQWYSRDTRFPAAPSERRTQSEWRVFLSRLF